MIYSILLLGLLMRLVSLNQSFWLDETTTATVATKTFTEILNFSQADFHPPFYYLLTSIWASIFGYSEVAIRLLSVLSGIGVVYLVYKLSKDKFAALLAATSPLLIYYSQEARMYSLLMFLLTMAIYLYKEKRWLLLGICLAMAVLTDYLAVFVLPVLIFDLYRKKVSRQDLFKFMTPIVLVFIVLAPLFSVQLQSGLAVKSSSPQWWSILGGNSVKQTALFLVKTIVGRVSFEEKGLYILSFVIPLIAIGYGLLLALKKYSQNKLYWHWLVLPLVGGFIVSFFIPIFVYFRFIFVLPVLYILIASSNKKAVIGVLLLSNIIFSTLYLVNQKFHREDWRGLVQHIESSEPTTREVYFVADSQQEAFRWYARGSQLEARGPKNIKDNQKFIWVMRYVHDVFDPDDKLITNVEDLGYSSFSEYNFNGVVVRKYTK
jgi:mannosyltransferase